MIYRAAESEICRLETRSLIFNAYSSSVSGVDVSPSR
jgi:hypothetical protein